MDMPKEKLTEKDKSIIKSYLLQSIIPFALIGVIGLFLVSFYFYLKAPKNFYFLLIVSALIIIYLILLIKNIRKQVLDLTCNQKSIKYDVLTGKRETPRYGYSMNEVVDSKTQPVLVEHYLEFNNFQLMVEKQSYAKFNIGERLKLSTTIYTNRIIQIEKED